MANRLGDKYLSYVYPVEDGCDYFLNPATYCYGIITCVALLYFLLMLLQRRLINDVLNVFIFRQRW